MSTFEYLSVFGSIVVGLAVVRVLEGVASILDRRAGRRLAARLSFGVWADVFSLR